MQVCTVQVVGVNQVGRQVASGRSLVLLRARHVGGLLLPDLQRTAVHRHKKELTRSDGPSPARAPAARPDLPRERVHAPWLHYGNARAARKVDPQRPRKWTWRQNWSR
jgi:hypothetical protein